MLHTCCSQRLLVHGGGDHAGEMTIQAALPGTGQGFQDEGRIGLVQFAGRRWLGQRRVPDIQAASLRRLVGEGVGTDGQQVDGHAQLCGPLGEQVAAGNGNQGMRLGVRGEQQAQVGAYACGFAGSEGEALRFHWAACSAPSPCWAR